MTNKVKSPQRRSIPIGVDYDRAFRHLCHLVPLTEGGKAEEALDSVVTSACVLADGEIRDVGAVAESVDVFFGLPVDSERLAASIGRLRERGVLLPIATGGYRMAPGPAADVQRRNEEAHQLQARVRSEWLRQVDPAGVKFDPDKLWACLERYMSKVFGSHGVLAVQLLDSTVGVGVDAAALDASMEEAFREVPCGEAAAVREAIDSFFAFTTPDRTRYVAQLLDCTFTFFALSLDDAAASYLRVDLQPLELFLDTNVIFGLLDLTSSPHGQAAREVVHFIKDNDFPIKLYYHEETLREVDRTLAGMGSSLGPHYPSELSRAAVEGRRGPLRGIELRYHEINAVTPISVRDFLAKYNHVEDLLADAGVELFRESGLGGETTEAKALKIAEYQGFVNERRPRDPKHYEALNHDIVVWSAVMRRARPSRSALCAGTLFLTNDYLFHSFVSRQAQRRTSSVVLTTQLLAVLRPLGRRTLDLDRRFVEAFSAIEFRVAHSDYNQAASKVLGVLANYKDVSTPTAVGILANEVLMRRLETVDPESENFREIVESEVLTTNASLAAERDAALAERDVERSYASTARADLQSERQRRKMVETELQDHKTALEVHARAAATADETRIRNIVAEADRFPTAIGRWSFRVLLLGVLMLALLAGFALLHWHGSLWVRAVGTVAGVLAVVAGVVVGAEGLRSACCSFTDWYAKRRRAAALRRVGYNVVSSEPLPSALRLGGKRRVKTRGRGRERRRSSS